MATASVSQLRTQLDRDIDALQVELLRMGDKVDRAIDRAVQALSTHDMRLARMVIDDDSPINSQRYAIENDCLTTIATQQLAAGDLRRIIAAMHIAGELERIADHAKGIAHIVLQLDGARDLRELRDIERMSQATRQMLRSGLNAFVLNNVEQAERTCLLDDDIDHYHQQIVRTLLTYMLEDRDLISDATHLIWVSHNLERIGDRVVNLCQRTDLTRRVPGGPAPTPASGSEHPHDHPRFPN